MRKQTKLVAVLSAAALLAIGASMTSFAKAGWALDGDEWVWLDSNGDRVSNEWKKSADGNYYWLDEDGLIAENQIIEDDDEIYYVNEYGVRVKGVWQSVPNEDDLEVNGITPDELWYYFGANGRATRKTDTNSEYDYKRTSVEWSQGTDTFFFDTEGHMVTGWIDHGDDVYYCTEYGNAVTGWQELEPDDDMVNSHSGDYEDTERFNFKDSGKLRKADEDKTITWYSNGQYYAFDENGVLLTDWYDVRSIATDSKIVKDEGMKATADEAGYAGEYPAAGTGWVYSLDPDEDDYHWYYLVSINDGKTITRNVPFNLMADDTYYRAKQIKGKTYLFNADGVMQDGLVDLRYVKDVAEDVGSEKKQIAPIKKNAKGEVIDDYAGGSKAKAMEPGIYYFRKDGATTAGQMVTGKTAVTEDGDTNYYYFDSKQGGKALTNAIKDGIVYGKDGKRMDVDDDNSNQIKYIEDDLVDAKDNKTVLVKEGSTIIVTSAGKMRTANTTVKIEGDKYKVVKGENNLWSVTPAD